MSHQDRCKLVDDLAALRPSMLKYAQKRLPNEQDAEDAVSETVLQLLQGSGLDRYDPARGTFIRFVTGCLKLVVYDELRRMGRGLEHGLGAEVDGRDLGTDSDRDYASRTAPDPSNDHTIDALPPDEAARCERLDKSWKALTAGNPLATEIVATALDQLVDLVQSRSGGISFAGRAIEPGIAELNERRGGRFEEALLSVTVAECIRLARQQGHSKVTEETVSIGVQRLVLGRPASAILTRSGERAPTRARIDKCVQRTRQYLRQEVGFNLALAASKARDLVLRGEA